VVVVGYLGHFDVHLARLLFRRTPIVLDHLIGASTTAADRRIAGGGVKQRLLRAIDAGALRAADVIVVDTDEHLATLPERHRERAVVVLVGAPESWFAAAGDDKAAADEPADKAADKAADGPLRVVFYGLYTPLQGTPVIGAALGKLAGAPVEITMVGRGQDEAETRAAAAGHAESTTIHWVDWVPAAELPALVAGHDVCLGIFGTGEKALRVVPNKVYQGAAAGCAVVTSDTAPQRRVLGDAAVLVPAGDGGALADALVRLATDRGELGRLRRAARELARERFTAERVVEGLVERLSSMSSSSKNRAAV
jgi:glycosyltransferase involved in cell wall biosynthesis